MDALGAEAAGKIGAAFKDGKIDKTAQLIAHAALGGAMAAADGKDAASGALGGVVGEVAGDLFVQNWVRDKLAASGSMSELTQEDVKKLEADTKSLEARGVDIAKLSAGIAAALAGLDVDTAAHTGGNAAQNNAIMVIPVVINLIAAGFVAYDVYRLAQALNAGDNQAAARIVAEMAAGAALGYFGGKLAAKGLALYLEKYGMKALGQEAARAAEGDSRLMTPSPCGRLAYPPHR